ncbi:fatty acid--CoA ligase [Actinomadura vinacea]|uniref:Fatty acid--CoA ligase n=1 Tax=Actinomadura vinacea TaxID=115336 RepID=A0ABP5X7Z5_9ACTN
MAPTQVPQAVTMAALLDEHAARTPEAPALTTAGRRFTYAELAEVAGRYARAFEASGLRPGDRVLFLAHNGLPFVAAHFAASRAGVVLVGVNWRLSAFEVAQIVADAEPSLVLADHDLLDLLAQAERLPRVVTLDGPRSDLREWLETGEAVEPADRGEPGNVLMMLYTTGTTGRAKGAMISERNVNEMLREVSARWLMRPGMRFVAVLPLFHVSGTGSIFSTLFAGGEVILPPDASAETIARAIDERKATHSALVPTILNGFVHEPALKKYDLSSLEVLIYGAAPSGGTLIQDAMALMPRCGFTQGYGLTETCGGVSVAPLRRHGEEDDRPGTVGRACTKYEIRIVDPATLEDVPAGADGEVWLRGPQNALGYWNRPEETAAAFKPDGWFRTGDVGVLDEDGYLYLKDRLKDMIISGGENIYSVEVESALLAHPEILEVAVYGVPDEHWGERVKAVVVRTPGSTLDRDAVLEHARSRLARYKCPRAIEFVPELPKSGSGKILKHVLRGRETTTAG